MARPLSEKKRLSLIKTAVERIAAEGLFASTASIAKQAGVATGTLFTYFDSKETLFNQVFLTLKADIARSVFADMPIHTDWRKQMQTWWYAYVDWGVAHQRERWVCRQLESSPMLTEQTHQQIRDYFAPMWTILTEAEQQGRFYLPLLLTMQMMESMVETTIHYILENNAQTEHYRQMGFEMMWRAVVKP